MLRCRTCSTCVLDRADNGGAEFAYDAGYFESWKLAPGSPAWKLRSATANLRLDALEELGLTSGRLLDVGAAGGYLVQLASERGFEATGVEVSEHAVAIASQVVPGKVQRGTLDSIEIAPGSLDAVTLFDVLEHMPAPKEALQRLARWLKRGGVIAVTTPDVDSLSARLMAGSWPHYKEEHLFYPSRRGLHLLLESAGFEIAMDRKATKCLSLDFTAPLFERYPVPWLTPAVQLLHRAMPASLRGRAFEVSIGERLCAGRKR